MSTEQVRTVLRAQEPLTALHSQGADMAKRLEQVAKQDGTDIRGFPEAREQLRFVLSVLWQTGRARVSQGPRLMGAPNRSHALTARKASRASHPYASTLLEVTRLSRKQPPNLTLLNTR